MILKSLNLGRKKKHLNGYILSYPVILTDFLFQLVAIINTDTDT